MPIRNRHEQRLVELGGDHWVIDVRGYAFAGVQVSPNGYASTTGVIEVKRSLTGIVGDEVSFSTSVTPNMTSRAIEDAIEIRDTGFLHVVTTTTDDAKDATVVVLLSDE